MLDPPIPKFFNKANKMKKLLIALLLIASSEQAISGEEIHPIFKSKVTEFGQMFFNSNHCHLKKISIKSNIGNGGVSQYNVIDKHKHIVNTGCWAFKSEKEILLEDSTGETSTMATAILYPADPSDAAVEAQGYVPQGEWQEGIYAYADVPMGRVLLLTKQCFSLPDAPAQYSFVVVSFNNEKLAAGCWRKEGDKKHLLIGYIPQYPGSVQRWDGSNFHKNPAYKNSN